MIPLWHVILRVWFSAQRQRGVRSGWVHTGGDIRKSPTKIQWWWRRRRDPCVSTWPLTMYLNSVWLYKLNSWLQAIIVKNVCQYNERETAVHLSFTFKTTYSSECIHLHTGPLWESNPQPWHCKRHALSTEPHGSHDITFITINSIQIKGALYYTVEFVQRHRTSLSLVPTKGTSDVFFPGKILFTH